MGIASSAQYTAAIKKLFPKGDYWDAQFADPESDASLFVQSKTTELKRFRARMNALLDESKPESTTELIEEWERILLNELHIGKTLAERRLILKSEEDSRLNRAALQKLAEMFGLNIQDVTIPYRPRCFGFALFGQERIGSFLTFFVLLITVTRVELETNTAKFEEAIRDRLLANQIPIFYYTGE
jgi:uncharacterized protein YmfQ (DUF2313 family)